MPGWSKVAKPVRIDFKPEAKLVKQKLYPLKWEASKKLEKLIENFLEYGLLKECELEYNKLIPVTD